MRLTSMNNNHKGGIITSELAFRLFFALWWMQHTVLSFFNPILRSLPIIGDVGEYVIPVFMFLVLLFAIPYIIQQLNYKDLLFYIAVVLLVLSTMLFLPDNAKYIQEVLWQILGVAVLSYFLGVSVELSEMKKMLFWCSFAAVVLMYVYQLYQLSLERELVTDNMAASYNALPSVLFLFYYALENKKIRFWIPAVVGLILTFSYGTRGPIVAIIAFVLFAVFIEYVWKQKGARSVVAAIIFAAVLVVLITTDIMVETIEVLKEWFTEIGFSTRILDMFLEGEITYDSGREAITEKITEAIWEKPLLGYGLMGDRVILLAKEGDYAHNFFMEMWCDYGIFFGTLLIGIVLGLIVTAVAKGQKNRLLVALFAIMVMIKLLFSGSFIVEPYFFLMLGICIRTLRINKTVEKNC